MGHRACDKGAGSFGDVLDGNASGTTQDLSGDLQRHAVIPSREKKSCQGRSWAATLHYMA